MTYRRALKYMAQQELSSAQIWGSPYPWKEFTVLKNHPGYLITGKFPKMNISVIT